MPPVGRLAPTPSGHLHLGNALAFGAAWLSARRPPSGPPGRVLLRIEDLDRGRARPDVADSQRDDLRWLGLDWDEEVRPQSERDYPLDGIPTYRCACSRATRLSWGCRCRFSPPGHILAVPCPNLEGGKFGHPGTVTSAGWRFLAPPGLVTFTDRARGALTLPADEPILRRENGEAAYPLAVVLDDARDGVTEVVRGADLLDATPVQVRLHEALGLPLPTYLHVPVLLGPDGRKLSKSHGSTELRALRAEGWSPDQVWALLLPLLGCEGPLQDAVLDPARVSRGPHTIGSPDAL